MALSSLKLGFALIYLGSCNGARWRKSCDCGFNTLQGHAHSRYEGFLNLDGFRSFGAIFPRGGDAHSALPPVYGVHKNGIVPKVLDAKTPAPGSRILPRLKGCLDNALLLRSALGLRLM